MDSNDCKYDVREENLIICNSVIDILLILERRLTADDSTKFVGRPLLIKRALGVYCSAVESVCRASVRCGASLGGTCPVG